MNKWKEIYDFTPNEDESKNYKLLEPAEFKVQTFEKIANDYDLDQELRDLMVGDSDFLFELPQEYGGTLDQASIDAQKQGDMDITKGPAAVSQ